MLARLHVPRRLFRSLSTCVWEKRIDDFTPIKIQSVNDVFIQQYDWKTDCVEPKTRVVYPENGASFTLTESLELSCTEQESDPISAQIPVKAPLFVKCRNDASVDVIGHEADVDLQTETGRCTLKSVKAANTSIVSKSGSIQLNSIVSNCTIMTGGNVTAKKVQGERLTISTSAGSVNIGSIYAPDGKIFGKYGDIKIDNIHGNCKIVSGSGSVTIGSSKDNLDVQCRGGEVNITLQDIDEKVSIQSFGGPVKLYLSDEVCSKCMLSIHSSAKAEVTDEVKELVNKNNEASALVTLMAYDATVFVAKAKSWGESLWDKLDESK